MIAKDLPPPPRNVGGGTSRTLQVLVTEATADGRWDACNEGPDQQRECRIKSGLPSSVSDGASV